jgi:MoaA/NifB/PqqE/SkfB family radical SAM enzyme
MKKGVLRIEVDQQGHLVLPPDLVKRFGLTPGSVIQVEEDAIRLSLRRSIACLARVYIEPTNICNLDCRICMRNVWDEPPGLMAAQTFARILQEIETLSPAPSVFFGGYGEPLAHPDILEMVAAAKHAGAAVELITNGILLSEPVARRLIELGLDRLWVSIDGATPASYADVRLGDALPQVVDNLARLKDLRALCGADHPQLGIAFVAMQRNIADLPAVVRLGQRLGADQFSISNVLPHTPELQEQILYAHSMFDGDLQPSQWAPVISLPRMDMDEATLQRWAAILKGRNRLNLGGQTLDLGANTCPFVAKGSLSIRWDGAVSPCLPLMHSHPSYLGENRRQSHAFSVGNVNESSLAAVWNDPQYVELRQRLQDFDFSPCTFCNSCEMAETNREDCFGNVLPACGGCLWAQGFIQCP